MSSPVRSPCSSSNFTESLRFCCHPILCFMLHFRCAVSLTDSTFPLIRNYSLLGTGNPGFFFPKFCRVFIPHPYQHCSWHSVLTHCMFITSSQHRLPYTTKESLIEADVLQQEEIETSTPIASDSFLPQGLMFHCGFLHPQPGVSDL